MPGRRCWMRRPGNWRSGGSEGSALGAGVVVATGTAAPAGAASLKGIATTAVAAVFPAAGTGAALATSALPITTTLAVTPAIAVTGTAVVATASAVSTSPITTASATGSSTTGLGLVDAQGAAHQLSALQRVDGLGFHLGIRHLHEGEATLAPGIALEREGAVHHLTKGCKQLCHVFLFCTEGQIADKNAHEPGRPQGRSMRAPGPLTGQA